jgi:hypothetical protein
MAYYKLTGMSQGGFIPIELHPVANSTWEAKPGSGVFVSADMDQSPFWAESLPEAPWVSLVICRGVKMGHIYSPVNSQWYPIIFQLILKYQEIITICIMGPYE